MEELSKKRKGDEAEGAVAKKSRASDAGTDALSCTSADTVARALKKRKDRENNRIRDVSDADPHSMVLLGGASALERRRDWKHRRLIRDSSHEHPDSIELGEGGTSRAGQGGFLPEPEQQSSLPMAISATGYGIVSFHDPDPEEREFPVFVPPRIGGAPPVVSFRNFSRGLRDALFGPDTSTDDGSVTLWNDTNEPCISCTGYFTAGDDATVGPPVNFAVIHMKRSYITFLMYRRAGLASLAHRPVQNRALRPGEEVDEVRHPTLNMTQANQGVIRAAIHKLLTPPSRRQDSHPAACVRCGDLADWATSCCLINLCSYCLPREMVMRHIEGYCTCKAREQGGTTLLPLHDRSRDTGKHGPGRDWACTRQLLVQVEEEMYDRSMPRDIFLFRTFTSLEDLQCLRPPQRHTDLYHMTTRGVLRRVCTIRGAELTFLW